jgi:hypothetical protein
MQLWDVYRYLLTGVQKLTVISCHEQIQDVIADRFGIESIDLILIPSEHRHSRKLNPDQGDNTHYPTHFDRILTELSPERGEVFLVAAGFLGKIYCNEIKKRGGIGIDIGSAADMWLGYTTRATHEFSRPVGVSLDFDRLRRETLPATRR